MTTETKRHGEHGFVALEVALEIVRQLKGVVGVLRTQDADLARQLVRAASSIAANLAEGRGRVGKDRIHLFRVAAGSALETQTHVRVALAWGYVECPEVEAALGLLDRELGLLWGLTH